MCCNERLFDYGGLVGHWLVHWDELVGHGRVEWRCSWLKHLLSNIQYLKLHWLGLNHLHPWLEGASDYLNHLLGRLERAKDWLGQIEIGVWSLTVCEWIVHV